MPDDGENAWAERKMKETGIDGVILFTTAFHG
jgi:benzoyl-CoA reductase/2-hydroxyglutaryl-CoA dehydratase subunit BcrC/BadD/HgdB